MVWKNKTGLRILGTDLSKRLRSKYQLEFKERSYDVFLMYQDFNIFDLVKHNDEVKK